MAEFPALPLWTDALIGDTYHLTPAEFGAYMRLLVCAWRSPDCALPDDDIKLGRMVGDAKNWSKWRAVVMDFWTLGEDGRWRQKRLTSEREFVLTSKAKKSDAGRRNVLKRKDRASSTTTAVVEQPTPTPTPIYSEEGKPSSAGRAHDPWKFGYDAAKSLLAAYGIKNPGAVIGRLRKTYSPTAEQFMAAVQFAGERERSNIVEFLSGCLRDRRGSDPPAWSAQAHLNALQKIAQDMEDGTFEGNNSSDSADSVPRSANDAPRGGGLQRLGGPV